jgi:hypothetical protein
MTNWESVERLKVQDLLSLSFSIYKVQDLPSSSFSIYKDQDLPSSSYVSSSSFSIYQFTG